MGFINHLITVGPQIVYIYICIICVPLIYCDLQLMFAVSIAIHTSLFHIPGNIGVLPTAGGFGFPSHSNQNTCELISHFHSFISSLSCVSPCVCKVFIYEPRFSTAIWVWVNTYRYIFNGMNIHLPAILGFTRYQGFDS